MADVKFASLKVIILKVLERYWVTLNFVMYKSFSIQELDKSISSWNFPSKLWSSTVVALFTTLVSTLERSGVGPPSICTFVHLLCCGRTSWDCLLNTAMFLIQLSDPERNFDAEAGTVSSPSLLFIDSCNGGQWKGDYVPTCY